MFEGTPPGDALPPPQRRATPARKGARCGASAGSPRPHRPHPGHTGRGTLTARSRGRTAGRGTAPDAGRPSQRWKTPPPGTPFRHPHSEQRRPARAHAVGPVLDPHARIDRTRDTRVAEPWLPAPEDGRPGEGQRLTPGAPHNDGRHPPGDAPPPPPQRATPARKGARCGAGAGSTRPHRPHPGHTGRGTLAARSRGRAVGGGTAPDTRRPSQRWKAPPPGTPFRHLHSEQRRPARAHAVGPVLGPHARIDRTRDTRVTEPWLPAPEDGRPGEGQRLTPDAPRNAGKPPPGMPIHHPHTEQRTSAPTHQARDIRTPPPALRHSDTAIAEPGAPRKTRPRSPTLNEAHEVIRALGLRDGHGLRPGGIAGAPHGRRARGTCAAGGQRTRDLPRVETGPLHRRRLVPQTAPPARPR